MKTTILSPCGTQWGLKRFIVKRSEELGASMVEFAIVLFTLVLLLQASLMLCEHLSSMGWLENTTHQLSFQTSQAKQSDLQSVMNNKRDDLLQVFNNRGFWRLFALGAPRDAINNSNGSGNAPSVPEVVANISTGDLNLSLQGSTQSMWKGMGDRSSRATIARLSGSLGYSPIYDTPSNSLGSGSSVTFSCSDGVKNGCTGGLCSGTNRCNF